MPRLKGIKHKGVNLPEHTYVRIFFSRMSSRMAIGAFMQNQDAISEPRNRNPMESQKSKGFFFLLPCSNM